MHRKGFTLIELLVSTSIIVLMLAMSLPSFIAFQRRQNLATAADLVRDAVLEANNYALAPRGGVDPADNKDSGADLYRIIFLPDQVYQVEEQRINAANPTQLQWKMLKSSKLSKQLTFCGLSSDLQAASSEIGPDKGIIYSISQLGKIVHPDTGSDMVISIGYKGTMISKDVIVQRETGQTEINDSNVDCS